MFDMIQNAIYSKCNWLKMDLKLGQAENTVFTVNLEATKEQM